jgi:hypothetical protein
VKDYSNFTVNAFVLDEFFESWVLKPDAHSNAFWTQWLNDHPEKARDVDEAREIIKQLAFSNYSLSETDISDLWVRIKSFDREAKQDLSPVKRDLKLWYKIAASVILFASLFLVYSQWKTKSFLNYHTAYGDTAG